MPVGHLELIIFELIDMLVCRDGQYVFVFGGTGFPFGESISNILYILDLKRLIWRRCRLHHDPLQEVYGAVRTTNRNRIDSHHSL